MNLQGSLQSRRTEHQGKQLNKKLEASDSNLLYFEKGYCLSSEMV